MGLGVGLSSHHMKVVLGLPVLANFIMTAMKRRHEELQTHQCCNIPVQPFYSGAHLSVCQHGVTIYQANGIWLRHCVRLKELIDSLVSRKVCQGVVVLSKHNVQVSMWYKRQIQCYLIRALCNSPKKHLQER